MIDRIPPEVTMTIGEIGTSTISVSVSAQDASGIAKYRYDYKETDGEWHEGEETNSVNYTFGELQEQTRYYLRVYVTDNAGNDNFSEEITARTNLTEKNPGDEISNITTDEPIIPGAYSSLITTNLGKTIDYAYRQKTVTFSEELSGYQTSYSSEGGAIFYVYAEDNENLYLTCEGKPLELKRCKCV